MPQQPSMSRPLTPTLYLSVENATRELHAKLLVGCQALSLGYEVVLGQQWLLNHNLGQFPAGLVLFKGCNKVQTNNMGVARRFGHRTACVHEEGFGVASRSWQLQGVDQAMPKVCDLFLAQGKVQAQAFAVPRKQARAIAVTGNPRSDLLRAELNPLFRDEAAELRARYGRFILFDGNFGTINSVWGSVDKLYGMSAKLDGFAPDDPHKISEFNSILRWERANLGAMRRLMALVEAHLPEVTVIVRPHPSERLEPWQKTYDGNARVKVVRDGNHLSWILASEVMVHCGCTTGLEAMVMDHPVLNLRPDDNWVQDIHTSRFVNHVVATPEEGLAVLRAHLAGDPVLRQARQRHLKDIAVHLSGVTGGFAFEAAAAAMGDLLNAQGAPPDGRPWQVPAGMTRMIERSDYFKQKMSATAAEVNAIIARFGQLLGRFAGIQAETIGDSLFVLRRAA